MPDDLPTELHPEDLPDDPELLKQLVCDLYAALVASEEFDRIAEDVPQDERADLGWLTEHLAAGGPAGHDPDE